jgi:mercuric ion binding protein
MKQLMLIVLAIFIASTSFSEEKTSKFETVVIQTSAQCGDCKERIDGGLNYMKGISFAELDLESKKVTVKFNTSKITLDGVKKKINAVGYDADDSKADPEAIKRLPACCKPVRTK